MKNYSVIYVTVTKMSILLPKQIIFNSHEYNITKSQVQTRNQFKKENWSNIVQFRITLNFQKEITIQKCPLCYQIILTITIFNNSFPMATHSYEMVNHRKIPYGFILRTIKISMSSVDMDLEHFSMSLWRTSGVLSF